MFEAVLRAMLFAALWTIGLLACALVTLKGLGWILPWLVRVLG